LKKVRISHIVLLILLVVLQTSLGCISKQAQTSTEALFGPVGENTDSVKLNYTQDEITKGNESSVKDGILTENAAPIGVTIQCLISSRPFSQYGSRDFTLYIVSLTLLDVYRDEEALQYINRNIEYPSYLNQPVDGLEYIYARFKIEYQSREPQANQSYRLKQGEFLTYSTDKILYDNIPFILPWKPDVQDYEVFPGDTVEIVIASMVKTDDSAPLMYYATGSRWFVLG